MVPFHFIYNTFFSSPFNAEKTSEGVFSAFELKILPIFGETEVTQASFIFLICLM